MMKPDCKPAGEWPIPRLEITAVALIFFGWACASTTGVPETDPVRSWQEPVADGQDPPAQDEVAATPEAEAQAAPEETVATAPAPARARFPVHGSLSSTYRARWTAGEDDHDLYEVLSLDFGDPARHAWTGHAMTRVGADLDGQEDEPSPFFDLNDTYDGAVTARLYDAWAERRGGGTLARVRIGRQTLWETPVFAWFDGLTAETRESGKRQVSLGAYGGIPVHVFESLREGDLIGGAYAQARPWERGRLRLDWMHLEDEGTFGEHREDLWKLGVWHSFSPRLQVDSSASLLSGEERDWSASALWREPDAGLTVQASYYRLLRAQRDLPPEIDPFFAELADLFPYHQARLLASKDLGRKVAVQAGADVRRVEDEDDEGQFNRDFERVFSTVQLHDVLPAGLVLGATGEVWDAQGSDLRTWGLDLSRRFGEGLDASLGSAYALYKFDAFANDEREHVRTWYARLRWKRSRAVRWDLRYEVEDADIDTFQSLRLGMTWRF